MRQWVTADRDLRCGYDWCLIKKGDPVQVVTIVGASRLRCVAHASGPIDFEALASQPDMPRVAPASSWQPVRGVAKLLRPVFDAKARQAGES